MNKSSEGDSAEAMNEGNESGRCDQWQPIETFAIPPFVPDKWYSNVARVLVFSSYIDIATYGYTERGKGRWQNSLGRVCYPTHWMPLPAPPASIPSSSGTAK